MAVRFAQLPHHRTGVSRGKTGKNSAPQEIGSTSVCAGADVLGEMSNVLRVQSWKNY